MKTFKEIFLQESDSNLQKLVDAIDWEDLGSNKRYSYLEDEYGFMVNPHFSGTYTLAQFKKDIASSDAGIGDNEAKKILGAFIKIK